MLLGDGMLLGDQEGLRNVRNKVKRCKKNSYGCVFITF